MCGSVLAVHYKTDDGEKFQCLECRFNSEEQRVFGKDEFIEWCKKTIMKLVEDG